jgi:hypothetical protein
VAPSKEEAAERRSQLWCGEPGWDRLRKAIENYCVDLRHQRDASRKKRPSAALAATRSAYCGDVNEPRPAAGPDVSSAAGLRKGLAFGDHAPSTECDSHG